MNIKILLPYKEQYLNNHSSAVSIFVKDHMKYSKYKKNIFIYGLKNNVDKLTNFKNNFISIAKSKLLRNYFYVKKFSRLIQNETSIVELHNRPSYFVYLNKILPNNFYILYIHNNPLELNGSQNLSERIFILNNCKHIVFLSDWIKKKFFTDIDINKYNNYSVIYPGVEKLKKITKKKNIIFFCGKLNTAKGYDLFCESTGEFLKKNKDWSVISAGEETRRNIKRYSHIKELGQISHKKVLKYIKISKITIAPSKWDEPLGRLPIESAGNAAVCISSDKGGLLESNKNGLIIKNISKEKIFKCLKFISINKNYKKLQRKIFSNFDLTNKNMTSKIDEIRSKYIIKKKIYKKKLKIIHISNFNDNSNGRLYYSTPRKISKGFIKLGHNVVSLDEKLFFRKKFSFFKTSEFNNKVLELNKNFLPDLLIFGHINSILPETLLKIKQVNPQIKIIRIYIDSISKEFIADNSKYLLNNEQLMDQIFITSKYNNFLVSSKNKISFIPNIVDASIEILKNFNNNRFEFDLFFALSHGQNRGVFKKSYVDERDIFLEKLDKKTPFIKKYFIATNYNKPLWGSDYFNVLSKCQMGLNISRGSYQDFYSSDRISSLFGNGLLVFLEKKTKLKKFFSKEAIFFNGVTDLAKKLNYYKKNQKKSRIIAKKGYLKYHKYFSNTQVCNYILKKLNLNKLNKKFIWEGIN